MSPQASTSLRTVTLPSIRSWRSRSPWVKEESTWLNWIGLPAIQTCEKAMGWHALHGFSALYGHLWGFKGLSSWFRRAPLGAGWKFSFVSYGQKNLGRRLCHVATSNFAQNGSLKLAQCGQGRGSKCHGRVGWGLSFETRHYPLQ